MRAVVTLLLAAMLSGGLLAQEPLQFENERQKQRFEELTAELRCLVCQNQSLADSDAPLAHDLREEVLGMMLAGQSDDEIRRFLVERYGDFVLYRPPVKANTLVLWLAPGLLLVGGAALLTRNIRRRNALLSEDISAVEEDLES
jgi:cytochrome c-type biogenesis protein CcmH